MAFKYLVTIESRKCKDESYHGIAKTYHDIFLDSIDPMLAQQKALELAAKEQVHTNRELIVDRCFFLGLVK